MRLVVTPLLWFVYRGWALDAENVPKDGAFILAPNHFSNLDHFFAGVFIRRKIQFMAKSQLYGNPILNYIFRVGGVFPVRRGHHDEEAFITAAAVLKRGGCVGMYCEGGRSRSGRLGEPKAGVGRLALESGVPVVPLAIHGTSGARAWKRLRFPKVTLQYGEPISFPLNASPSHEEALDVSRQVFDRVKAMYVVLEAEGRKGAAARIKAGEFQRHRCPGTRSFMSTALIIAIVVAPRSPGFSRLSLLCRQARRPSASGRAATRVTTASKPKRAPAVPASSAKRQSSTRVKRGATSSSPKSTARRPKSTPARRQRPRAASAGPARPRAATTSAPPSSKRSSS